jgi:hypothetical protein
MQLHGCQIDVMHTLSKLSACYATYTALKVAGCGFGGCCETLAVWSVAN